MVAQRRIFTPCPPSPARSALNKNDAEYILSWLTDLAGLYPDLQADLPGYAKALFAIGYKTFASLAFMHPDFSGASGDSVAEVQKALKINVVLAKAIVAEGLALHPRDVAAPGRSSARSRSPPLSGTVWSQTQVSVSVSASSRTQVASLQRQT